jgi:hypothetical protein
LVPVRLRDRLDFRPGFLGYLSGRHGAVKDATRENRQASCTSQTGGSLENGTADIEIAGRKAGTSGDSIAVNFDEDDPLVEGRKADLRKA